jgi:hypothetical protein
MLVTSADTRGLWRRPEARGLYDRGVGHAPAGVKDQYAGDVNDYLKYALLRALAGAHPGTLQVCWMLTASDGRADGGRLAYLDDPEGFADLDPQVFQALCAMVRSGRRTVAAVQDAGVLGGASFHAGLLGDGPAARERYFAELWGALGGEDLVFFDPDNGLQVASVAHGRRNSCKYLFWEELKHALGQRRSACVYQHFPRVQRAAYIDARLQALHERFPGHAAFAVSSSWVAHLVCARPARARGLHRAAGELVTRSAGHLTITPLGS